jgi:hypothetical protein
MLVRLRLSLLLLLSLLSLLALLLLTLRVSLTWLSRRPLTTLRLSLLLRSLGGLLPDLFNELGHSHARCLSVDTQLLLNILDLLGSWTLAWLDWGHARWQW